MSYKLIAFFCLIVSHATFFKVSAIECVDVNGDKNSEGWKYLRPLAGKKITVPDKDLNSTYTIGVCTNVLNTNLSYEYAGVAELTQDNQTIVIGRYNESELMYGSHWILLKYLNGEPYPPEICSSSNRHAAIMFVCNHDVEKFDTAKIIDENLGRHKDCYHLFEVEHCLACISDGCDAFFNKFSPGSVILIGLFSIVGCYLLFGWVITRFCLKRKGWRQIPNAEFWQEIGHLQADGCAMACRCGKRREDDYHVIPGDENPYLHDSNDMLSDDEGLLPP